MTGRPFAAFDIDGTILRWQLYHAVADELGKQGLLDPKEYRVVREARLSWKKRKHQASYSEYEAILVEFFDEAILKLTPAELKSASEAVIDTYKDQVYAYTRDLIQDLKTKNYLLFAISASHEVIVKMLADYYGFDEAAGSVYQVKNGHFTGESQILRSENKVKTLNDFVKKHKATWNKSVAVGDSESDIPMLSTVEQPIAFNPSKELFEHAKQKNWQVVLERKNMTYHLESKEGKYWLS
jgi:HAD superfamily hydrolase (TIGR01490 family)